MNSTIRFSAKSFFLIASILSSVFISFSIDADSEGRELISDYFQHLLAIEFLIFLALLYKVRHALFSNDEPQKKVALAILAILMIFSITREPAGFKVIYDEPMLSVTAMNMHYNRNIAYPNTAYEINGRYELLSNHLDKRPAFFPFLTSLLHDISGYRVDNVFYLNMILTCITIALLYLINRSVSDPYSALFSVALFSTTPLIAQNASGGGFEILNITMLLLCIWVSIRYLDSPSPLMALLLCFAALFLTQTRYESILYIPFIIFILYTGWRKTGKNILSLPIVLFPLLFIPPIIHLQSLINNPEAWQVSTYETSTFGLEYLFYNIGAAIEFLFSFDPYTSSNFVFSLLGSIALLIMTIKVFLSFTNKKGFSDNSALVVYVYLAAISSHFIVILLYHDGDLSNNETNRYALPLMLAFSVSLSFLLKDKLLSSSGMLGATLIFLVSTYIFSFPAYAMQVSSNSLTNQKRANWILNHFQSLPRQDHMLFIHDPWQFILHKIPATRLEAGIDLAEKSHYHLTHHTYSRIFVVQDYIIDPDTGALRFAESDYLDNRYKLKTISQINLTPFLRSRLSIIEDIDLEAKPVAKDANIVYQRKQLPYIGRASYSKWLENLF